MLLSMSLVVFPSMKVYNAYPKTRKFQFHMCVEVYVLVPNFCRDPEFVFYDRPDTTMFAYR